MPRALHGWHPRVLQIHLIPILEALLTRHRCFHPPTAPGEAAHSDDELLYLQDGKEPTCLTKVVTILVCTLKWVVLEFEYRR